MYVCLVHTNNASFPIGVALVCSLAVLEVSHADVVSPSLWFSPLRTESGADERSNEINHRQYLKSQHRTAPLNAARGGQHNGARAAEIEGGEGRSQDKKQRIQEGARHQEQVCMRLSHPVAAVPSMQCCCTCTRDRFVRRQFIRTHVRSFEVEPI